MVELGFVLFEVLGLRADELAHFGKFIFENLRRRSLLGKLRPLLLRLTRNLLWLVLRWLLLLRRGA